MVLQRIQQNEEKIHFAQDAILKYQEFVSAIQTVEKLKNDPDVLQLNSIYQIEVFDYESLFIKESKVSDAGQISLALNNPERTKVLSSKQKEKRSRIIKIYDEIIRRGFTMSELNEIYELMYGGSTNQKGIVLRLVNEGVFVEVKYNSKTIYYAKKEHVDSNGFKRDYEPTGLKHTGKPTINYKVNLGKN